MQDADTIPSPFDLALAEEMERWSAAGLRRSLAPQPPRGTVDFTSNDVLDLARHEAVVAAASAALAADGASGRASRLLGGGSSVHALAEERAARWLGCEAALLFPSGYQANAGLLGALVGRGDALFSDALNHASLVDGARLARARVFVHAHLDLAELERQLARARAFRRRVVVTEGVFSMDGDRAPLLALAEVCARHDAWLVVDEAHAIGLLGPEGAGAWAAEAGGAPPELAARLVARVVTGGKALGAGGALVLGSRALREHLVQHARAFVFSTAPPPAVAGALAAAIALVRDEAVGGARRAQALARARQLADALGLPPPAAAVVPWVVGASEAALSLAFELAAAGFDARAVRPPTVPEGTARLRLVCHASNTPAEVDELARRLKAAPPAGRRRAAAARPREERALFVVGTDTGVGKTVVSALCLRAARALGPAAYWKPVQTGADSDTDAVGALAGARPHELLRPAWQLALPASPHEAARAEGKSIRPREIEEGLGGLLRTMPEARFVVELAGGLLVPYRADTDELATQADWLARARAACVLVARSSLGTLNHTLLTLEALRARHLEPRALFLVGEPHPSNRETLRAVSGVARVLELPPLAPLDGPALERWLAQNDLAPLFA